MATPPLSTPIALDAAAVLRCVDSLRVPPGWTAAGAEAVEREGLVFVDLLLSGPLVVAPRVLFEIPLTAALTSTGTASADSVVDLQHALTLCEQAAQNPALEQWAAGLSSAVARLDVVGDFGRLLCRGTHKGAPAEPLWL